MGRDANFARKAVTRTILTQAARTEAFFRAGVDVTKLLPTSHNFSLGARDLYHESSKSYLQVDGYVNPDNDKCILWAIPGSYWKLKVYKPAGLSNATEVTYLVTISGNLNVAKSLPITIKRAGSSTVVTTALPEGDFALPLVTKAANKWVYFEYDHNPSNFPIAITNVQVEAFTTS